MNELAKATERADDPAANEKVYMEGMKKKDFEELEKVRSTMLGGASAVEEVMRDGGISPEDFEAYKRVLKGLTVHMNEYVKTVARAQAEEDNKKVDALRKQIEDITGPSEKSE